MPLSIPATAGVVVDRALSDVQLAMQAAGAKPFVRRSWLRNLVVAFANRVFDFYFALAREADEALPDTAVRNLERWAAIFGLQRTAGVRSTGPVWANGNVSSVVPSGAVLADGAGTLYVTTSPGTIDTVILSVQSITRVGSTATVNFAVPHGIGRNALITVAGAVQTEYNVTNAAIIAIPTATSLTYAVTGSPVTPATGTITLSRTGVSVPVRADAFLAAGNQPEGTVLVFESPQSGIQDATSVTFAGLAGGSDRETDIALRARLLDRIQNPVAHFNVAEITARAKAISGVTRVFVFEITPAVGQVTIYFMRDNDVDPIPDATEIAAVNDAIQAIRPATSAASGVIVLAPSPIPVNFNFLSLSPSTMTMKDAVTASLRQFFAERTSVGVPVTEDQYRTAIFSTVDPATGLRIASFTLQTPVGTVAVTAGQIATLGTVSFP